MRKTPQIRSTNQKACILAKGRAPLTIHEILELEAALFEVFRTIRQLRERSRAARHIKFPSVPSVFSESIAIATTSILFGSGWNGRYGGRTADVVVENSSTRRILNVEVKATGQHAFQELKGKDLRADVLIWIRFGQRLELGTGPIEVAVIEHPGKYVTNQCRLDVRRLEAIPGIQKAQKVFRFESLKAMLNENLTEIGTVQPGIGC